MKRLLPALLLLAGFTAQGKNVLQVHTIDVEGGKAVLFVGPSGESMLIDAGWPAGLPNREASAPRIAASAKGLGLRHIDHVVISHFDGDHLGDVPALAALIPIRHVYDHGEFQPAARINTRFTAYDAFRKTIPHTVLRPGDRVPLKGVDALVVASAGQFLKKSGAPNPACAKYPQADVLPTDVEDNLSVGLLVSYGKFRMLDLADLEAHHNHELVCPSNPIGAVDVCHVNVHGQFKGMAPALMEAIRPRVALLGNGARKGADPPSWPLLRNTPGLEDIWQVHYSAAGTAETNPPPNFIVNLEPADGGLTLKLEAQKNGSFTVTNPRNGFTKTYRTRASR